MPESVPTGATPEWESPAAKRSGERLEPIFALAEQLARPVTVPSRAGGMRPISPSTIVRYENGSRTASPQNIAAMIECIETAPVASYSPLRGLLREMTSFYDVGQEKAEALVELWEGQPAELQAELEAEIEDRIPTLGLEQLKVVAAIVRDPGAIEALLALSRRAGDPLAPVLDALKQAFDVPGDISAVTP